MTRPAPPQVGHVRSIRKKPCCARTFPAPSQVGAGFGGPLPSPSPCLASFACNARRNTDRVFVPAKASVSETFNLDLDVCAGAGAIAAATTSEIAEHLVKDVSKTARAREVEASTAEARATLLESCMPEAVISSTLLIVL